MHANMDVRECGSSKDSIFQDLLLSGISESLVPGSLRGEPSHLLAWCAGLISPPEASM